MLRYLIAFSTVLTVCVWGGGDVAPNLSSVAPIGMKKSCNEPKVYIEKDTGLMWQDAPYTEAETGAYKRNRTLGKAGGWKHAVNYCRSLVYAGYSDWRLPTADELQHVHRKYGQVFTYHRDGDFWSSTPTSDSRFYVVYPADAYRYKRYKKESNYIRCVRCIKEDTRKNGYRIRID